ncbi:uncharacterized protein LOC129341561 isoform X1 [Eublepharis macularius]|uniref:Uncharacterized protein LOC129341561 isoform X1 n=1 Tax=Eublepharis macularius TaxID=481883 RepID=A0AA97LI39_EUBMA|nr:uncharacterized protein LOC129341561 isoform X1 [Eublepharis macularius]
MPPKKGVGNSKGKQPAKRPKVSGPPPDSSSDEEDSGSLRQEILAKLALLERAKGVSSGQVVPGRAGRASKKVSRATFQRDVLTRLSVLESSTGGEMSGAGVLQEDLDRAGPSARAEDDTAEVSEVPPVAVAVDQVEPEDGALSPACTRRRPLAISDACGVVESWRDEVHRAIRLAIAPSTRRAYDRAVRQFMSFRIEAGLEQCWPIPAEHLMQFCVARRAGGLSVKSIRGLLAALAFISKARGVPEMTGDFRIRKMLEGWSREAGARQDARQPISPAILKGLVGAWQSVCLSGYEAALFHAAALTAFFGALRVGELVAQSRLDLSQRALLLQDVRFVGEKVSLRIRSSKTDQHRKGSTVWLGSCADAELCPVRGLRAYLEKRGDGEGLLFRHCDESPLTRYQFWSVTGRALAKLGLEGFKFGTHSFRIGAASTAAAMGYTDAAIRRVGRWRSAAYRGYVRPLPAPK